MIILKIQSPPLFFSFTPTTVISRGYSFNYRAADKGRKGGATGSRVGPEGATFRPSQKIREVPAGGAQSTRGEGEINAWERKFFISQEGYCFFLKGWHLELLLRRDVVHPLLGVRGVHT